MIVLILLVQVAAFAGLVVLLRWLFSRHVTAAMGRVDLAHQENLRKELELKNKLAAAEGECQEKLRQAQAQAAEVLSQAKEKAQQEKEELIRQARGESERIIQEALGRKEEIRQELQRDLDEKAAQLGLDAIRQVLTEAAGIGLHGELVDELLEGMASWKGQPLEIRSTHPVEVVTSRPLTAQQGRRLEALLTKMAGRPVEVKEAVDPGIVAGMIVRSDHLLLDGSLSKKLKEALGRPR